MLANGPWPVAIVRRTRLIRSAKTASQPTIVAYIPMAAVRGPDVKPVTVLVVDMPAVCIRAARRPEMA